MHSRLRIAAASVVLVGGVAAGMIPGTSGAFTASVTNSTDTAKSSASWTLCDPQFTSTAHASSSYFEYALGESASTATATDLGSGANTGRYVGNAKDPGTPRACPYDAGSPFKLSGASELTTTTAYAAGSVTNLTLVAWFKATGSGVLIEHASSQTGTPGQYDRMLYVGTDGLLYFGLYPTTVRTLSTASSVVAAGGWHLAVATLSSSAGMTLYLDGSSVATSSATTSGQTYDSPGYWRVGGGNVASWPNAPASAFFNGSLRYIAAYSTVWTPSEVSAMYAAGTPA